MEEELTLYFEKMLGDLQCEELRVILVPAPEKRHEEHYIRVSVSHNIEWYRNLCSNYGIYKGSKFKTKIKRANIIRVLNRLILKKNCKSLYVNDLIYVATKQKEYEDKFPF